MILDDNVYTHIRGDVVYISKKQTRRDGSDDCVKITVDMNRYGKVELERVINKKQFIAQCLPIGAYIGGNDCLEEIEHNVIVRLSGDRVYITKFINFTVTWNITIDVGSEVIDFYRRIDGDLGCANVKHLHISDYIVNNC